MAPADEKEIINSKRRLLATLEEKLRQLAEQAVEELSKNRDTPILYSRGHQTFFKAGQIFKY